MTNITNKLKFSRGITMIELMSAVVVVGIMSAMAVPRMQVAWERLHFRTANKDMISMARLARSNAISEKQPYGVYFDGNAKTYTMYKDIQSQSNYTFDAGDSVISVDTLPPEFTYLATMMSGDAMVFQPNGSVGMNGSGLIVTLAMTDNLVAIQVHTILASTGRIQTWSEYY